MVGYARATSRLLGLFLASSSSSTTSYLLAYAHEEPEYDTDDAWTYLDVVLPTSLSDMSVSTLPPSVNFTSKRIIITGGCDSPEGNEFVLSDWGEGFACMSVSSKAYAFVPTRSSHDVPWTGTFATLPDMPRPRCRHASAVVTGSGGTVLCVFGGRDALDGLISEVDCYDPSNDVWSTPTSLPDGRASSDLAAFAHPSSPGIVYLVGGYDGSYLALDNSTIVTLTMDETNATYVDGPVLTSKRGDVDVAIADGYAYVSGGFTHEDMYAMPRGTVERLWLGTTSSDSPAEGDVWKEVDSLNQERGDKQLVGLHGRVYAIGGETKLDLIGVPESELPELGARSEVLDTVEVYDPLEDLHGGMAEWRELEQMPASLFRFGAIEWEGDEDDDDGYIFVFGGQVGYDGDCKCFRTTDKVLVFDVHHAEEHHGVMKGGDGGASSDGTTAVIDVARAFSIAVACASLLWIAL